MRIDWRALAVETDWKTVVPAEPDRVYEAFSFHIRVKSLGMLPAFFSWGNRVWPQLRRTPGVIGFCDRTPLLKPLEFYTLSAWQDVRSLGAFIRTAPHADAIKTLTPLVREFVQVRWPIRGEDLPPAWPDALRRLEHGQRLPAR